MTPSIAPEVERELIEGAVYYAREGGVELGRSFITEFERVVEFLGNHPQIGAEWRNGRRRFPLRRFHYSVIYYLRGEELRIVALAHHRRMPDYWAGRK